MLKFVDYLGVTGRVVTFVVPHTVPRDTADTFEKKLAEWAGGFMAIDGYGAWRTPETELVEYDPVTIYEVHGLGEARQRFLTEYLLRQSNETEIMVTVRTNDGRISSGGYRLETPEELAGGTKPASLPYNGWEL